MIMVFFSEIEKWSHLEMNVGFQYGNENENDSFEILYRFFKNYRKN